MRKRFSSEPFPNIATTAFAPHGSSRGFTDSPIYESSKTKLSFATGARRRAAVNGPKQLGQRLGIRSIPVKPLLILKAPILTHHDRAPKLGAEFLVGWAQALLSRGHTQIGVSRPSFSAEKGVEAEREIKVKRFLSNEIGLELSEYAVAAALITTAILVALTTLGNIVTNSINTLANQISP